LVGFSLAIFDDMFHFFQPKSL